MNFSILGKLSLPVVTLFLLIGCAQIESLVSTGDVESDWQGPRVFAIGYTPSLSFTPERDLEIPIEGLGLWGDLKNDVTVTLDATYPINSNDYSVEEHANAQRSGVPDSANEKTSSTRLNLVIKKDYLSKVETGDQLNVTVHISPKVVLESSQEKLVQSIELLEQATKVVDWVEPRLKGLRKIHEDYRNNMEANQNVEAIRLEANALFSGIEHYRATIDSHRELFLDLYYDEAKKENTTVYVKSQGSIEHTNINTLFHLEKVNFAFDRLLEIIKGINTAASTLKDISDIPLENKEKGNLSAIEKNVERLRTKLNEKDNELREYERELTVLQTRKKQLAQNGSASGSNSEDEINQLQKRIDLLLSIYADATREAYEIEDEFHKALDKYEEFVGKNQSWEKQQNDIENAFGSLIGFQDSLNAIKTSNDNLSTGLIASIYQDSEDGLAPVISSRDFTFYEVADYRQRFVKSRLRPDDISAFPLPADEVVDLFGHYIAGNYFVVRLSVRNTETQEKIINSGMIRVSGRAMVEVALKSKDKDKGKNRGDSTLRYTVPIEVTPHSKEQIYTVLDDTEVNSTRSISFRALEFVGALAAGYSSAFIDDETTAKAVSLFTGIFTPELKKLYVDRYPDYKRNVVNYGMEDLTKVPVNGTTTHKFLFFPRSKIEAVILDPNSYGEKMPGSQLLRGQRLQLSETSDKNIITGFQQPNTFIVYLTFDNMDIPLEYSLSAQDRRLAEEVIILESAIRDEIAFRELLQNQWGENGALSEDILGGLTYSKWSSLEDQISKFKGHEASKLAKTIEYAGKTHSLAKKETGDIQSITGKLYNLLSPSGKWRDHLINSSNSQTQTLEDYIDDLKVITRALARGENPSQYKSSFNLVNTYVEDARHRRAFYVALGRYLNYLGEPDTELIVEGKMITPLQAVDGFVQKPTIAANIANFERVIKSVISHLKELDDIRGVELKNEILDGLPIYPIQSEKANTDS